MQHPSKHVLVIGGGMAGLAAAVKLCEAGIRTTLMETNAHLGGRARGVSVQGQTLDNGQHMLLGAYRETLAILRLAGADVERAFWRMPLNLNVFDLQASTNPSLRLQTAHRLPAPLHLLLGLLLAQGLNGLDKARALRWLIQLKWSSFSIKKDISVETLLQQAQQTQTLIDRLWEPLCLGALNTPLENASAKIFLNVLRDSFNRNKHDSDIMLAKHDLSTTLCAPLADYITRHGGQIVKHRVNDLRLEHHQVYCDANDTAYSHAIVAVAPHQRKHLNLQGVSLPKSALDFQAITTVYLQFEAAVHLPQAMLGFCHGTTQWVFDRGQICGQAGLLAVVISAHGAWQMQNQTDKERWVGILIEEINRSLEHQLPSQPLWFKIITEKKATFSCEANTIRPSLNTDSPQLWLAGDDAAGDYPATIEGAVISGMKAAQAVIQQT